MLSTFKKKRDLKSTNYHFKKLKCKLNSRQTQRGDTRGKIKQTRRTLVEASGDSLFPENKEKRKEVRGCY